VNAYPIGNLGTTKLKIELYKGVFGTVNVHLTEK
jgi:large subunit ribosomal protein L9